MRTGPRRDDEESDRTGVVVPLRSFALGKARLAPLLDREARAALVQRMAETVIAAAGSRPIVVVSSAPEVLRWCAAHGLAHIDDPGSLDAAAHDGRVWARAQGLRRIVVVHADLPRARTLDPVTPDCDDRVAVLVPDHRADGTPVVSVPVDAPFRFAYGAGSFDRHVRAARDAGLPVRVVRDPELGFDIDLAEDLEQLESLPR